MEKKNKNIALAVMSIIPIKILIHFFFFNETYRKSISSSRRVRGSRRGNNNDDVFQYIDENLGYYISNVFSEKLWIFLFIIILFSIAVWYFNYTKDVKIFFNLVIKNFNNYFNILRNKIGVNNNHINKNNESKFDFQDENSTEKIDVLEKNLYKKDISGLKDFSKLLESKYLINFKNFIISWFSLTIMQAIVFPIIRGGNFIDGSINTAVITGFLGQTFAIFFVFYFPVKLLVFVFSKKHKWPTGWGYHILPWIYMFWFQYMQSEHYRDYINNLRLLID
jgi:hypothetical protein